MLYEREGVIKVFFLGKYDGELNINVSKKGIKGIAMSEGLVIVSSLTVRAVGKVWLELFVHIVSFISFHMFFRSFIFS